MNFLADIRNDSLWQAFLEEKEADIYMPSSELRRIRRIVEGKTYLRFSDWILSREYLHTPISKRELAVSGKDKRRVVYCYDKKRLDYQFFFKFVNMLLREFDSVFSENLYSFRSGHKIGGAVRALAKDKRHYGQYKAKLDIHDYFRSIEVDRLMPVVRKVIPDEDFLRFLEDYLSIDSFQVGNKTIVDHAGVFPGNPISGFLSNLYLSDLDADFQDSDVTYFRYADDILICADNEEELLQAVEKAEARMREYGLEINPKKKEFFPPNAPYHFLGLSFTEKGVTISRETVTKIKGKIRRSARKIRRWVERKKINPIYGVRILVRKYNAKFFGIIPGEQSWIHWYLPYIQSDEVLREVDRYFYQEARYVMTGDHSKKGYKVLPYERLARLGHRSLVREYHALIETRQQRRELERASTASS